MRTVAIFKNGQNRAVRLPRDLDFEGINELEIIREEDCIILKPVRLSWLTLAENSEKADADFLAERDNVIEEGRFSL